MIDLMKIKALAASTLAISLLSSIGCRGEPSVFPTGVTRYDPSQAYNCYTVFASTDRKSHLIDMNGHEVHSWSLGGFPSTMVDPKLVDGQLGHVFVQVQDEKGLGTSVDPGLPAIFRNKTVGILDWGGHITWEWGDEAPGGAARQHHDEARLANGDTLLLVDYPHHIAGFAQRESLDDQILEIDRKGKVVWSWLASDHLGEFGFTPQQLDLVKNADTPDYLHMNVMRPLGTNKWANAGDHRFSPENLMISSRNANFVAIIDKASGRIVWRIGPNYPKVPVDKLGRGISHGEIDQISGQHDAHIIPEGLPGAGNLLLFDNQGEAGYPPAPLKVLGGSRVLEIDPIKKEIVWSYEASLSGSPKWTFYSRFLGSARRLPNGNTLVDEGMNGRLFQVTSRGNIVWEYISPYSSKQSLAGSDTMSNWVYRAQPVFYDWVPKDTQRSEMAVVPSSTSH